MSQELFHLSASLFADTFNCYLKVSNYCFSAAAVAVEHYHIFHQCRWYNGSQASSYYVGVWDSCGRKLATAVGSLLQGSGTPVQIILYITYLYIIYACLSNMINYYGCFQFHFIANKFIVSSFQHWK